MFSHQYVYIRIFTRLISLGLRYTVRVAYNVKSYIDISFYTQRKETSATIYNLY